MVITTIVLLFIESTIPFDTFRAVDAAKDLNVKVSIGDDDIGRGDTQKITVTVTRDDNSNSEISGANVKLIVFPPGGDSTTAKDKTDDDGKATFDVKISDDAEYGTYEVDVKASKDGFDTDTEESSFKVTGSRSDDDNNTHDDKGHDDDGDRQGKSDDGDKSDAAMGDVGDSSQALSQGNACGNGFLSSNILCQNVANQLQGDGNAINIIAVQNGGSDGNGQVKNGMVVGKSSSVPMPQNGIRQPLSTNADAIESIVNQYVLARLDHAIETRLSYLK
jgi:hypothetical protein